MVVEVLLLNFSQNLKPNFQLGLGTKLLNLGPIIFNFNYFLGKNAVVAGRSHNVGLPIAMILQADHIKGGLDLTTTICHRYTPNEELVEAVSKADVVVSAAGVPGKGLFIYHVIKILTFLDPTHPVIKHC